MLIDVIYNKLQNVKSIRQISLSKYNNTVYFDDSAILETNNDTICWIDDEELINVPKTPINEALVKCALYSRSFITRLNEEAPGVQYTSYLREIIDAPNNSIIVRPGEHTIDDLLKAGVLLQDSFITKISKIMRRQKLPLTISYKNTTIVLSLKQEDFKAFLSVKIAHDDTTTTISIPMTDRLAQLFEQATNVAKIKQLLSQVIVSITRLTEGNGFVIIAVNNREKQVIQEKLDQLKRVPQSIIVTKNALEILEEHHITLPQDRTFFIKHCGKLEPLKSPI